MTHEVTCITKPNPQVTTAHITHIGYLSPAGSRIIITVHEAVNRIDANRQEFFIRTVQGSAYLEVVRPTGRDPYLRTVGDDTTTDNLLNLASC